MCAKSNNNVEVRPIKAGWAARNRSLRVTAHGATEHEARLNLISLEATLLECRSRYQVVKKERFAELRDRLEGLAT